MGIATMMLNEALQPTGGLRRWRLRRHIGPARPQLSSGVRRHVRTAHTAAWHMNDPCFRRIVRVVGEHLTLRHLWRAARHPDQGPVGAERREVLAIAPTP